MANASLAQPKQKELRPSVTSEKLLAEESSPRTSNQALTPERPSPPPPAPEAVNEAATTAPETQIELVQTKEKTLTNKEEWSRLDEAIEGLKNKLRASKKKTAPIPLVRDELTRQVEYILEEGLTDVYGELTPTQKQEFKLKGEQTARQIRQLLKSARVKVKKIFQLILAWLKLMPGVNRFFLEQEAKIKADKIIALKEMSQDSLKTDN